MEELLQTYTKNGEPLTLVARSRVHQQGLWHKAANVFLLNSEDQLLIQKRAQAKDVCPGLWDLSVAEHLSPSESFEAAAVRGLEEELGVRGVSLNQLGAPVSVVHVLEKLDIRDHEFQQAFWGRFDGDFVIDPLEVAEAEYIDLRSLEIDVRTNPGRYTPWFRRSLPLLSKSR